ncbi:MAG: D-tyrosyl-tRNA(Tyr) deacylase [Candidatus Jacksonbacteria bacterium RIFCSPLOWO2_02_FULL_43_9]|nr:MAG: D-tyrosyl-tRNA(Tyr) deacylase [Parcubacteria group bacterium GW2011_GWA2_43_13]OGY69316.1 MAG: D-tyrosyl-tRNA(Tyr) deacylase [Candidatus Jacksonbacteria bacterium RIFCSPHIGHO2_02_FULL_43_10]OGY71227.1 MAG: D-tyrosyl-tRNA(Tyr) deacylase [Candidatus Jacksonbacteria bacterium RIFCSPLOWO2_01_FULL_44_13]OGY71925.1 MAG: D-tyrosyl-tRNA(Tyr) deacylase [Candidatus Jacksonbacteria bacterium RIFCSPLOWO2_02_FULL_43_9]HAZ16794.1 D-tyrosyl-tRNA(Tyr) deacylase [Candidatus Jacksonbacteria bacterium]
MKLIIQRVRNAAVTIDGKKTASIEDGYCVLLGVGKDDTEHDADILIEKLITLRIMPDENDKMNFSIQETGGEILVISQFTLSADCRRGRRPSFITAATPEEGRRLYDYFIQMLQQKNIPVRTGEFGAMMDIELINNGPVTIILDSYAL